MDRCDKPKTTNLPADDDVITQSDASKVDDGRIRASQLVNSRDDNACFTSSPGMCLQVELINFKSNSEICIRHRVLRHVM